MTEEIEIPDAVRRGGVSVTVEPAPDGASVTVIGEDRVGLLADAAAMFALQRASVRAARAWTQGAYAVSVWEVADEHLDPAVLRQRFEAIADGRVDAAAAAPARGRHDPGPDASWSGPTPPTRRRCSRCGRPTGPGIVHLVCSALAGLDLTVRSAHVDTLGPQAVDVFYVQEAAAGVLSDHRAADAAHAVRAALTGDQSGA